MGYVLSDWSDESAVRLLRRVSNKLRVGGRLLILERLLGDDKITPYDAVMMDVTMMIETGGTHRTKNEYYDLLSHVDLKPVSTYYSDTGKHMIVAKK